jgi:hypothetical protein
MTAETLFLIPAFAALRVCDFIDSPKRALMAKGLRRENESKFKKVTGSQDDSGKFLSDLFPLAALSNVPLYSICESA